MANNCIVGISLATDSENSAANLEIMFNEASSAARKKNEGMFIGSTARYLFDSEVHRDRKTLFVAGWVKWGFSNDEVKEFLTWLKKQSVISTMHIDYEEPGNLAYGEYDFDGKTLKHHYLPESAYPDAEKFEDEEDDQKFAVALESAIKSHGVTEEIPMA